MPTHLIRGWIAELAKKLRNQQDYDDWNFGLEPIPKDRTWSNVTDNSCANPEKLREQEFAVLQQHPNP
jgi:hypothetical protein